MSKLSPTFPKIHACRTPMGYQGQSRVLDYLRERSKDMGLWPRHFKPASDDRRFGESMSRITKICLEALMAPILPCEQNQSAFRSEGNDNLNRASWPSNPPSWKLMDTKKCSRCPSCGTMLPRTDLRDYDMAESGIPPLTMTTTKQKLLQHLELSPQIYAMMAVRYREPA